MEYIMMFFSVLNFCLGALNLYFAHEAYKYGDNRRAIFNGLIGIFCIWSATL